MIGRHLPEPLRHYHSAEAQVLHVLTCSLAGVRVVITTVASEIREISVNGLLSGTKYNFKVVPLSTLGDGGGAAVAVTTNAPAAAAPVPAPPATLFPFAPAPAPTPVAQQVRDSAPQISGYSTVFDM